MPNPCRKNRLPACSACSWQVLRPSKPLIARLLFQVPYRKPTGGRQAGCLLRTQCGRPWKKFLWQGLTPEAKDSACHCPLPGPRLPPRRSCWPKAAMGPFPAVQPKRLMIFRGRRPPPLQRLGLRRGGGRPECRVRIHCPKLLERGLLCRAKRSCRGKQAGIRLYPPQRPAKRCARKWRGIRFFPKSSRDGAGKAARWLLVKV